MTEDTPTSTPPSFSVSCETTKGSLKFLFTKTWSPLGYDRLYDLFSEGFYDNQYMYRVVPRFLVQFGVPNLSLDPALRKKYNFKNSIKDDPPTHRSFERGAVSFAGSGPNSRVADLFISYTHNAGLGNSPWEVPVGYVTQGMEVVESFQSYGDISAFNPKGPNQNKLRNRGKAYVKEEFPLMDKFLSCHIEEDGIARNKPLAVIRGSDEADFDAVLHPSIVETTSFLVAFLLMLASGLSIVLIVRRLWFSGPKGGGKLRA